MSIWMLFNKEFGHGVYIDPFSSEKVTKCLQFVMFFVEISQILSTYNFDIGSKKVIFFCIYVKNMLVLSYETFSIHTD